MSDIQNPAEVVGKRKNILQDDEQKGLKVTATLRDQQLERLATKLEDMDMGNKIVQMWAQGESDRTEWLGRQQEYMTRIDEFIEPLYTPALDWASTLHLPTILTVCKTYHSRMLAALWGIDPPFVCRSRKASNADRAELVEELMRYTLRDWCNEYDGVEEELDKWLWDWITKGDGYLKGRWAKKFTRFQDVKVDKVEDVELQMDEATGNSVPVPVLKDVEREETVTEEVFNGPMLQRVFVEDIIIIGGEGDPQKADAVLEKCPITASEAWSMVDQKLFRKEQVEDMIRGGKDLLVSGDEAGNLKQQQIEAAGRSTFDRGSEQDRYELIEAHIKVDVDGSGITSDLIVWVHKKTRAILRATYLRRVMPTGKRPYFRIAFHKRHGVEYSVGLVELLYSLDREIDAMHNINIDVGVLSSLPFGFYRPTTSTLKEEALPIEPGALIPVDNPGNDVFFPNLGIRTSFGFQEQSALMNQVERLTSISELNLGVIGAQGATRTATGTRALLGESSNNLNVYIQRMNRGWKRALRYTFDMLQQRLPPGFQFRVVGDDGDAYWKTVEDRAELEGMYDFELDANSSNSNKQVQIEQANMAYQLTSNPLDMQLGIVTPSNRYEAILNMLKVNGFKAACKFITRPAQYSIMYTPIEIADRILSGVDVPLDPTLDWGGFLKLVEEFQSDDELNGQVDAMGMAALMSKAQEAQQLVQAMQQAGANANVASQQNMNTQASMVPGNMQPVAVTQPPPPGEGGY